MALEFAAYADFDGLAFDGVAFDGVGVAAQIAQAPPSQLSLRS